jgi:hypothetical protein
MKSWQWPASHYQYEKMMISRRQPGKKDIMY